MQEEISITTKRLFLRRLDMRDSEAFFRYRSLPEVCRFQSWHPKDVAEIETFLLENSRVTPHTVGAWLQLAVCLADGRMIGDIGIHFLDADQIESGYTLSPEYQGNGYAREAVRGVMDYSFQVLRKHRITASVDPENVRSIRLLTDLGFRKEAHFIRSYRVGDSWHDDCVFATLAEEQIGSRYRNK